MVQQEAPERLNLGAPQQDPSSGSATGVPPGNQSNEPSLDNLMDFERSLADQIPLHSHTQSAAMSNPYDDSSANLPLFPVCFHSARKWFIWGVMTFQGMSQYSYARRSGHMITFKPGLGKTGKIAGLDRN